MEGSAGDTKVVHARGCLVGCLASPCLGMRGLYVSNNAFAAGAAGWSERIMVEFGHRRAYFL